LFFVPVITQGACDYNENKVNTLGGIVKDKAGKPIMGFLVKNIELV